jgi:hypothetical protein
MQKLGVTLHDYLPAGHIATFFHGKKPVAGFVLWGHAMTGIQMERDGLLTRTTYPVVPPRVEYKLTELGLTLGGAFCGVWVWAAENLKQVEQARRDFDERAKTLSKIAERA